MRDGRMSDTDRRLSSPAAPLSGQGIIEVVEQIKAVVLSGGLTHRQVGKLQEICVVLSSLAASLRGDGVREAALKVVAEYETTKRRKAGEYDVWDAIRDLRDALASPVPPKEET